MNLTNQVENRILIGGSIALTLVGMWIIIRLFIVPTYTTQIEFLQAQNKQKDITITELAKIAKYSINNDFEKMRTKKGGSITLDLNNKMDVESQELNTSNEIADTTFTGSGKVSVWKRLFGK